MPRLRVQLFLGLFVAANVMALSFAYYGPSIFGADAVPSGTWGSVSELFEYLILFLTTIVLAALGLPLAADALSGNRRWYEAINAESLVCLGVFAAFTLSVINTANGTHRIYYDTVTLVLVILTLGKHLEARAKQRAAGALTSALDGLPSKATIQRGDESIEVEIGAIEVGDLVRIRPGESIPVDGVIESGSSFVRSAGITGEPHARPIAAGETVYAGSIALDGLLWLRAERVAEDRLLAQVDQLVRDALTSRSPAMRQADRVARILAPAMVAVAVITAAVLASRGLVAEGILRGLSVLLIACPCALVIAPGLILATTVRRAASRGLLFGSNATLEATARLTDLFFDKTGTLTASSSEVEATQFEPGVDRNAALQILASIEAHTDHPVAVGLVAYAKREGVLPRPIAEVRTLPGLGVESKIDGALYRVGSARLINRDDVDLVLLKDDQLQATIQLADPIREGAVETLRQLTRLKIKSRGISGDSQARSAAIAEQLGIPILGEQLPGDKGAELRRFAAAHPKAMIGMVGDGINDAGALATADVGIAVASATELSRSVGTLQLLRDDLTLIPEAIEIARDGASRLHHSLLWAIAYNSVGVLLAVSGRLHPAFAATAMVVSSLLVIGYASGGAGDEKELSGEQPVEQKLESAA
jgi:Cu+-exporting ATPase